MGCALAEAGLNEDGGAVLAEMGNIESYATEAGLSVDEIPALTEKYKEDTEFLAEVTEEMNERCPETMAAIQES